MNEINSNFQTEAEKYGPLAHKNMVQALILIFYFMFLMIRFILYVWRKCLKQKKNRKHFSYVLSFEIQADHA